MQAAAVCQADAERHYARDLSAKNAELCTQLGMTSLALAMANETIVSLKCKLAALEASLEREKAGSSELEALLEEEQARIAEYEARDEAQDRLSEGIWGRREGQFSDSLPVLLDSPCPASFMDQPLQLGRVVWDLGYVCKPAELRKLGALAYEAFTRVHGTAPVARVFYGKDGSPARISCFTRRDRDLVINVISAHRDTLFSTVRGSSSVRGSSMDQDQ
jgi:hypothetical protein